MSQENQPIPDTSSKEDKIKLYKSMFPKMDEDVINMLIDQYGENIVDILLNLSDDTILEENLDKKNEISENEKTNEKTSEKKKKRKTSVMEMLGKLYSGRNSNNTDSSYDYHEL